MLKPLIALTIEIVINQALKLDAEREFLLQDLQGKTLAVEVSDWRLSFCFAPQTQRLRVLSQETAAGTAVLRGSLLDLVRLGLSKQPQAGLAEGRVVLEGEVETLQTYQKFMQQLQLDWEALLAKYLGLTAAHEIARPLKKFAAWQKTNAKTTAQDFTEYLQEEFRLLPPREEVEDFYNDMREFRAGLERLDARVQRLRKPGRNSTVGSI